MKSALLSTPVSNRIEGPGSFKETKSVNHGISKDNSVLKNSHAVLNQSKMYELDKESFEQIGFDNSYINKSDYNSVQANKIR